MDRLEDVFRRGGAIFRNDPVVVGVGLCCFGVLVRPLQLWTSILVMIGGCDIGSMVVVVVVARIFIIVGTPIFHVGEVTIPW